MNWQKKRTFACKIKNKDEEIIDIYDILSFYDVDSCSG
jgi:hypothetical protein